MGQRRCRLALSTALLWGSTFGLGNAMQPVHAATDTSPGAKGAQIYCFMRNNGNNHQVSWDAAYALIKRQSASLFKTSPEHAAVMITEAVVQNPGSYPDCGRFLGDLFAKPVTPETAAPQGSAGQTRSERLGR
ncbi:MAG: DUF6554 family protein [Cyanobacteriota bacterium]|nr:DUF6554 family protein [Cyanobacteriota bacterium]